MSASNDRLEALKEQLAPWKCCGAPPMCGTPCQDDELSDCLARAYRLVDQAIKEGPYAPARGSLSGSADDCLYCDGTGVVMVQFRFGIQEQDCVCVGGDVDVTDSAVNGRPPTPEREAIWPDRTDQ